MSGFQIFVNWRTAVTQENGDGWCFPNKLTPYFRDRYATPAVYRWRVVKRQPGEKERIYIGEGEDLIQRIAWVIKPHSSAKPTDTNRRLNEIFSKCASGRQAVVIDCADIEPFEINGIRFEQRDIGDRFKRRMLENFFLVMAQADGTCELLNSVIDPLDRDREVLNRLTPRQVRETVERYGLRKTISD
jgi:hypothetical protein